jgi:hypothetical protein
MPEHTSEELLAEFDRCLLHARYWVIFGLVSAVAALDFFDFSAWVFWSRRSDDRDRINDRVRVQRDPVAISLSTNPALNVASTG